ncbi:MAG: helix-turn-helix transcriptional regulator [Fibrobacteres bacterium]|nr:helix-turn-helix transcriptional regulator [Fibrobacterota bacterium]
MNFSEFLKSKRAELNLNQVELSKKAGVGLRFIRDVEQGKKTIRLDKLNQVLSLFGCEAGPVKQSARNYT